MVFNKPSHNLFMEKKTIIITGITGFLGKRIADHFTNSGFLIIAPTRNSININDKNSNLNNFKNSILDLVNNFPEISAIDLQKQMCNKGFTVQINNFMQSKYPTRLNLDLNQLKEENMSIIIEELLSLLNFRNI